NPAAARPPDRLIVQRRSRLRRRVGPVGDAPDGAAAVFADEERAVLRHRDAHRPAPDRFVRDDEAGHEVLVFAGRLAVLEANPDDLVAGALAAVPGAVHGDEGIALVLG